MVTEIPLVAGTLPSGFCPATHQELYNKMFELGVGQLTANYTLPNYGDSTPAPEDQNRPWIRTIAGAPDGTYVYAFGKWVRKHEIPASSDVRVMWVGSLVDLQTYDGGNTDAIDPNGVTGPFWEEDTTFAFRSPIGVGTLPDSGTVLAVGDHPFDHDEHEISVNELPEHTHPVTLNQRRDLCDGCGSSGMHSGNGTATTVTDAAGANTTTHDSFSIVHPVKAVYFIKRTARIYRSV